MTSFAYTDVIKKLAGQRVLLVGGAGFIGSNFVHRALGQGDEVTVYDALTYAGNMSNLAGLDDAYGSAAYRFVEGDVCDGDLLAATMAGHDAVVHFAAESHVDRSITDPARFVVTNCQGTATVCEVALRLEVDRLLHVSTDEVYGEVSDSQCENAMLNPTNPYAATKAAAEFIAKSYLLSFVLPVIITRGNNVYGKYQYPEKLIPRFSMLLTKGEKLTIQGSGKNTRTFIHANDVAKGFETVLMKGFIGEIYNIGSRDEHSVLEVASLIVNLIKPGDSVDKHLSTVKDRDFNDTRYDIDCSKLHKLGWKPVIDFAEGFKETVEWYHKEAIPNGFWSDIKMEISDSNQDHPTGSLA